MRLIFFCILLFLFGSSLFAAPTAELIIYGGDIVTMNDRLPNAEAVAVKDGKIVAVGSRSQIMAFKGGSTRVINLKGKTLVPGFVDPHSHIFGVGLYSFFTNLYPSPDGNVNSIDLLVSNLKKGMPNNTAPAIIAGNGYDDSQLAEKRHPNRNDLDQVSTEIPVIAIHQSGHLVVVNSKALELLNINDQTPDPQGGKIVRFPGTSTPTGLLEEKAMFNNMGKLFAKLPPSDFMKAFSKGIRVYARYGYTTAQEGRATAEEVTYMYLAALFNELPIDVVAYADIETAQKILHPPFLSESYTRGFRLAGAKLTLDGSPQGKTAWLSQPYLVPPDGESSDYKGSGTLTDAQVGQLVGLAYKNNWQLLTHVNGDAAIDQLQGQVSEIGKKFPSYDRRWVAIHAQTARQDQIKKFVDLKIIPSLFPLHTFYWGDWYIDSVLGLDKAQNISPTGWVLQNNAIFTSHSDAPIVPPNPLRIISATVNRTTRSNRLLGPEHKVSPLIALKAMTLWSAYQYREEKSKGSIEVGKLADFAILSANPIKVDPTKIADIAIDQTLKEGVVVFSAEKDIEVSNNCMLSEACATKAGAFLESSGIGSHRRH